MKKIVILGSTGSIGTQCLDIVRDNKEKYKVTALTCGSNTELLAHQIEEFGPELAVTGTAEDAEKLRRRFPHMEILYGAGGLETAASADCHMVVNALVGMRGLLPTYAAIAAGRDVALANKETLVAGGEIIMAKAKEKGVRLLPVDSEHSAIFQCLEGNRTRPLRKILLTASGGPFRGFTADRLKTVTLEQALKHPNWSMGKKITIDSATMMNKGLEVMEARWLFDVSLDQIQVVVQPQSVIHSMVEFKDGGIIAQLGTPDMRLPIQYALYYPHRRYLNGDRLDFAKLGQITFEEPDMDTFLGLPMAIQAAQAGGSMPTVFNAANELAVKLFLQEKIRFLDIYQIIGQSMGRHKVIRHPDLDQILAVEKETYQWIESRW